jgi:toxin-antitoxin system PIN domain toxin
VRYLLDVNALVAALWSTHVHNGRIHAWINSRPDGDTLLTCGLTEAGFIRVINAAYAIPVHEAKAALRAFRNRGQVEYLAVTPSPLESLPLWARGHKQIMDAYLTGIAEHHGVQLATLDRGIPGSKIIS